MHSMEVEVDKAGPITPTKTRQLNRSPAPDKAVRPRIVPSYDISLKKKPGLCIIINNEDYAKSRANTGASSDIDSLWQLLKRLSSRLKSTIFGCACVEARIKGVSSTSSDIDCGMSQNNQEDDAAGDRDGSTLDVKSVKKTFADLGFTIVVHNNPTKEAIVSIMKTAAASDDLKNYNCLVVVLLSHGGPDERLICVDGQKIKIFDDIMNSFNGNRCPALQFIPKWFIIQACRGAELNKVICKVDSGNTSHPCDEHDMETLEERKSAKLKDQVSELRIGPGYADYYISYATPPGYAALRLPDTGSPFIYEMCDVIKEYSNEEDVSTMMSRVNNRIALSPESEYPVESSPGSRMYLQARIMPCHVNILTKLLFLQPKVNC